MIKIRQITRAAAVLVAVVGFVLPPRAVGTITRPDLRTAALIPHCASSLPALHLSSPAVALTPMEAALAEMCRNDPVNNLDPDGLDPWENDVDYDPVTGQVLVQEMDHRWWNAHMDVTSAFPVGQKFWRPATETETKYWQQYKAGDPIGARLTYLAGAGIEKGYEELLRLEASLVVGTATTPFGGGSLLGQALLGSLAGSAAYEVGGLPMGDPLNPERFATSTALGTAGGVVLGKVLSPSARFSPELTDDLILTGRGTLVPAGQFGGTGGIRFRPPAAFNSQQSVQNLRTLVQASEDDALIGFIQNGNVTLLPTYRGGSTYYAHADFIRAGMIQRADDLLGFQVIKYQGKVSVHGMSELNLAVDAQGRLPAPVLEKLKKLLGL